MTNAISIKLKQTTLADLPQLFQFQIDKEGAYLAAFMPSDYTDETAYLNKYTKLLADPTVNNQSIYYEGKLVGSIAKFVMFKEAEITYWIAKSYWGKGIASQALSLFLQLEKTRPLHARVAFDNYGSQQVLAKAGFLQIGSDKGFAYSRQQEIEEYIYKLDN